MDKLVNIAKKKQKLVNITKRNRLPDIGSNLVGRRKEGGTIYGWGFRNTNSNV